MTVSKLQSSLSTGHLIYHAFAVTQIKVIITVKLSSRLKDSKTGIPNGFR
jgi:hypothetical protein